MQLQSTLKTILYYIQSIEGSLFKELVIKTT